MENGGFWTSALAIGVVFSILLSLGTLLFIARQTAETRQFTQAQFINSLQREFDQYADLFMRMRASNKTGIADDMGSINDCLDFFERLKTLLDTGAISVRLVDRAFGYSFFLLANDRRVQDRVLYTYDYEFPQIFALHQQLAEYRRRRGLPIPRAVDDLATRDATRYAASLRTYAMMR